MKVPSSLMSCDVAVELMSPFIDSMVTADEADSLRLHVVECASCKRQLQSFISFRNLVAGIEPARVPDDLQLETRVRLSHARLHSSRDWWRARFDNIFKPFAVPAVMGIVLTLLGFAVLLGSLTSARAAVADDSLGASQAGVYQPPTSTEATLRRLVAGPDVDQVLSMQTEVNNAGRIYDYSIIAGTRSPGIDEWLQELVLLSQFRPATYWGLPVRSRVILSFVTVRG